MHSPSTLLLLAAATLAAVDAKVELSTMSLNVRTAVDNAWDHWRGDLMVGFVNQVSPDFIGLQENTQKQYDYLLASTDGYASIGGCVEGDGGACAGSERTNIMYKEALWELIDGGDFHLSGDDYDHPSETAENTYGLQYQRVVTWGRFKSTKDESATVCYFNTHYDPGAGQVQSSKLIRQQMLKKCKEEDLSMFTGDLNAPPESGPLTLLTGDDSPFQLTDALEAIGNRDGTLVGGGDYKATANSIFDFVLARAKNLCITGGDVLAGKDEEERYDSDHRHPVADFCIGADCSCKNNGGGGGDNGNPDGNSDMSGNEGSAQHTSDTPAPSETPEMSPSDTPVTGGDGPAPHTHTPSNTPDDGPGNVRPATEQLNES